MVVYDYHDAWHHASAATTLNIYAHLWPGDDEVIRRAVDRGLVLQAEDWLRTGSAER